MTRKATCPVCGQSFALPRDWVKPPFRCQRCGEQLQASIRFSGLMRYLWVVLFAPLSFLVFMNAGARAYWIYLVGAFVIYLGASFLSATIFPLEIKRYESTVTAMNITK